MTDLEKLTKTYDEIGIEYTVRTGDEGYHCLFMGPPESAAGAQWLDDRFDTTPINTLCLRNKFIEFEPDGSLASY